MGPFACSLPSAVGSCVQRRRANTKRQEANTKHNQDDDSFFIQGHYLIRSQIFHSYHFNFNCTGQSIMTWGCTGHSHDHDHDDELGVSLLTYIDLPQVYCLNEHRENAGRDILKPHVDRLSLEPNLRSDDDDIELLMHIPFSEAVAIKDICISGRASIYRPNGSDDDTGATSAPFTCKVFANRTDLDFDTARDLDADATIELLPPEHMAEVPTNGYSGNEENQTGTLDYPLRPASKFRMASSITLFFGNNYAQNLAEAEGDDDADVIPTEITYIGLKGRGTSMKRVAVECVYETRGMKKDHKTPGAEFGAKESKGF